MPQVGSTEREAPNPLAVRRLGDVRGSAAVDWLTAHHAIAALFVYVLAALLIERRAAAHLGTVCACNGAADPSQFMWALVWWPHAVVHGLNPFITQDLWAGSGVDLARATSVPAAGLVATPLTAVFGPVVAYNVITLASLVLGAWFAYRLCLYITKSPAASILGGYLFGFSSYELGHVLGLLHLAFVFAPPALALLTLKWLDEEIGSRHYFVLTTALLVVQLLLSTEILLTLTCIGAVALASGWLFGTSLERGRIVALLPLLGGAYGTMVVICSPFLYYALFTGHPYSQGWGGSFPADALSFLIPTPITWLGGHRFASVSGAFLGNLAENGTYVGLPVAIIVAAFAVQSWVTRTAKVLLTVLAMAVVWSLGNRLYIDGRPTIRLPWAALTHVPLFDQLLPVRIVLYIALVCSVVVALWIATPGDGKVLRWGLGLLTVALLLPNTGAVYPGTTATAFHARLREPAFFTDGLYKRYLRPHDVVLPIPYAENGLSMLWQARASMYFRLASGYFGSPPSSYSGDPIVAQLTANTPGAGAPSELGSFIVRRNVAAVIADSAEAGPWPPVLAELGLRPASVGGILLYKVPKTFASSRAATGSTS
jgi:hypothetical protein